MISMSKSRVLIVHNYYKIAGGEDTVVENERALLENNGHKVFMYTRNNKEIGKKNIFIKIVMTLQTIYSLKTYREIKKIIKSNNIDIVHVHNTLPLISPSVYKAAKKSGAKVIQTLHNFRLFCPSATFTCNGQICEKCLHSNFRFAIKKRCYRNSLFQTAILVAMLKINRVLKSYDNVDAYIALTNFTKRKFGDVLDKNKVYLKPNFTKNDGLNVLRAEEREYFVFVGRLDKLKGIDVLLKSWEKIVGERLIILGDGPEYSNIQNIINEKKINNIELGGLVKSDEVKNILARAKALIVPSIWYETFGMVVIESFSVGTPVIASDIGALSDIVNYKNGIKFKVNSEQDLINAVMSLVNTNNLQQYIDYCYKEYLEKYSADINYKMLMDIYDK